ncbi:MAG: GFA family protein [Pikeienuella sp.]
MTDSKMKSGACLCGAVTVSAKLNGAVQACHCQQCQTWTGGGPYYVARGEGFQIKGEENIKRYRSSEWAERAFCGKCGTTLFWQMTDQPLGGLAAGLFAGNKGEPGATDAALTMKREIFTDIRPAWVPISDAPEQWTEGETMAHFGFGSAGEV